jgi:ribose transport system ATP-binding protein
MTGRPLIDIQGLTMQFPAVLALADVSLQFARGEVHGLVGENGAGKSTLMRILSGLQQPTRGRILLDGREVSIDSPATASRLGIVMIHQELNLVDELSVAANIYLGREKRRFGLIDRRTMNDDARRVLASVGAENIPPNARVASLPIAQQQMVEIAKAVSQDARLLIMDEPTAVLTANESRKLFTLIRRLKSTDVTIIYISHILPEVIALCDRITVLRDGKVVRTIAESREGASDPATHSAIGNRQSAITESHLASLMVGRPMADHFPPRSEPPNEILLTVRNLTVPGHAADISFDLRRGEILGFAGLIGAGRTEMAEGLVGLRPRSAGSITLDNQPIAPRSLRDAVRAGIGYLSEDRKGAGLTLGMDIVSNTTLVSLKRYTRGLINRRAETRAAREHVQRLRTRVGRLSDAVATLSGGNQQKVLLAKWLEIRPRVLIIDEPTRGVDIGAKEEIYRLIKQLTDNGMACILISSEMNELLGLAHRIAIMRKGRLAATIDAPGATEDTIMLHAAGIAKEQHSSGTGVPHVQVHEQPESH